MNARVKDLERAALLERMSDEELREYIRKWESPEAKAHFKNKYGPGSMEIDDPEPLGDETPFDPDGALRE